MNNKDFHFYRLQYIFKATSTILEMRPLLKILLLRTGSQIKVKYIHYTMIQCVLIVVLFILLIETIGRMSVHN